MIGRGREFLAERSRRARRVERRIRAIATSHVDLAPIPGCHGCELARQAGPGWVRIHRQSDAAHRMPFA